MASAGFEPANSGTWGQHANHLTTEAAYPEAGYILKVSNPFSEQQVYVPSWDTDSIAN
jgi:hypothetical protein